MKKLVWIDDVGPDQLEVGAVAKTEYDCQKIVTGFLTLLNNSEQTARLLTMGILKGLNASESDLSELKRIFDAHIETIKNKVNETTSIEPMHPILAKFHEAKEAGFEWADAAINAFDETYANSRSALYDSEALLYSQALDYGFNWRINTTLKFDWWSICRDLERRSL